MIPVSQELNQALRNYTKGNFGLWFNKFIELDGESEDKFGKPAGGEKAKEHILNQYKRNIPRSKEIDRHLQKIHQAQKSFLQSFSEKYIPVVIQAQLISRLITGLGQTHPTETGMVFDHNLGIPYIPAASVKGLVRASRRIDLKLSNESMDDDESTFIPLIFGGQKKIGRVIFLDAYPTYIPDMDLDIMTPHYGKYYEEGSNEWPGDWMEPTPIKFLTVAKGTIFMFRALVDKKENSKTNGELLNAVNAAYKTALTIEGVGGKTAVGYGRFKILSNKRNGNRAANVQKAKTNNVATSKSASSTVISDNDELNENASVATSYDFFSPSDGTKEYYLIRLEKEAQNLGRIKTLFQIWEKDQKWNTDKDIAQAFLPLIPKYKKGKGEKETHFYIYLKGILNIK